jgi:hypothetical protein
MIFPKDFPIKSSIELRKSLKLFYVILVYIFPVGIEKNPPAFGPKMFPKSRIIISNLKNFIKTSLGGREAIEDPVKNFCVRL